MADDSNSPWWEHALNALAAGYDAHSQKKTALEAQREAEMAQRKRQRVKAGLSGGSFSEAPVRRRVKTNPDEPCCDGPRRK
jgi:hypothetical protein